MKNQLEIHNYYWYKPYPDAIFMFCNEKGVNSPRDGGPYQGEILCNDNTFAYSFKVYRWFSVGAQLYTSIPVLHHLGFSKLTVALIAAYL
jgi:hypothetical protein